MIAYVLDTYLPDPPEWPGGYWLPIRHNGQRLSCLLVPVAERDALEAEIVSRGLGGRFLVRGARANGEWRHRIEAALLRQIAADYQAGNNAAVAASLDDYLSILGTP